MKKNEVMVIYRKSKGAVIMRVVNAAVSSDGTIWVNERLPISLGAESPAGLPQKAQAKLKAAPDSQKRKVAESLIAEGLVVAHYGDHGDVVAMYDSEWRQSEYNAAYVAKIQAESKAREEIEARTVSITLTTCGWGDYGVCEWRGDITRPDADILAECKSKLAAAHDPDTDPTDVEILKMIADARAKWTAKNAERKARDEHEAACLRKAADAGVRVEIRHYTCDCRDPHEECSLDIATVWAMPDGTTKTTYQHTW